MLINSKKGLSIRLTEHNISSLRVFKSINLKSINPLLKLILCAIGLHKWEHDVKTHVTRSKLKIWHITDVCKICGHKGETRELLEEPYHKFR